jgi:DNA-binding transcriptional MerR regulator
MDKLSIGMMAELNQVSVQTLRHYDSIGLLEPEYTDADTGYRYYNIKQSARLDMIQYLKNMGMPLAVIGEQFRKEDLELVRETLIQQGEDLERRINELTRMKKSLCSCMDNYRRYKEAPRIGTIVLERLPERHVFLYDGKIDIYQNNLATYEYILRQLKRQILLRHLPMSYFCNIGTIMRKAVMDAGRFESTELFCFVDEDFEDGQGLEIIPGNNYLCVYCDGFDKEKEHAALLLDFIAHRGYETIGDYICEVVIDFPVFPQNERNMFIKLQIPVKTFDSMVTIDSMLPD